MRRLIFVGSLLANGVLLAAVSVHSDPEKAGRVVLENEKLSMTFTPDGGRCVSFKSKSDGVEWVGPHDWGLFVDQWACYTWPSGLMHLDYTIETHQEDGRASVSLSVTVPAFGGGKGAPNKVSSLKIATAQELVGLKLTKIVTLESGSDVVTVRQIVENPTGKNSAPALSVQNHFQPGDGSIWSIPSSEGIIGPAKRPGNRAISGKQFTDEPVDGWCASGDTVTKKGLLFTFDYDCLEKIYSSSGTAEWYLEPVNLPSGETFETLYRLRPYAGVVNIAHANERLYAGVTVEETDREADFRFRFAAFERPLAACDVRLTALGGAGRAPLAERTLKLSEIGRDATEVAFKVPLKKPLSSQNNVVVSVRVKEPSGKVSSFEYNWIGKTAEEIRRYDYGQIGAGAAALAGGGQDNGYRQNPRPKIRRKVAQDFAAIRAKAGTADRVLVLFGLYTDSLHLHEALSGTLGDKLGWCNGKPNGIEGFPGTYEQLFANKLIVASNVGAKCLRNFRLEMLADWVREGGVLLVVGGFYTYGHGEFQGTVFEEMVPFADMKPFEIVAAPEGRPFELVKASAGDPCFDGVTIDDCRQVAYLHDLKVKPDAVVLAKAGDHPAIAVRPFGKGRVIGCAMTTLGEAEKPWYEGTWWKEFVQNLAR